MKIQTGGACSRASATLTGTASSRTGRHGMLRADCFGERCGAGVRGGRASPDFGPGGFPPGTGVRGVAVAATEAVRWPPVASVRTARTWSGPAPASANILPIGPARLEQRGQQQVIRGQSRAGFAGLLGGHLDQSLGVGGVGELVGPAARAGRAGRRPQAAGAPASASRPSR